MPANNPVKVLFQNYMSLCSCFAYGITFLPDTMACNSSTVGSLVPFLLCDTAS